ncbi:putative quinol monooxygenase [Sphingoaurantiacus capsulatus]|uniref:Quinol monooxygenase n=1 Tax=Sphingoaurantiacus capsulatus TaxID=1771310 RepID=A0ABV7XAB3_9SPHN
MIERRDFVAGGLAVAAMAGGAAQAQTAGLHGLIGKMIAHPGKRDELAKILLDGVAGMPGCLSYIVAIDPKDANAIWVTEVWTDAAAHAASLKLPQVRAAITKGRPLIAAFGEHITTVPLGGHGLAKG